MACKHCGGAVARKKPTGPAPSYCSIKCRRDADYQRHRERRANERRARFIPKPQTSRACADCGTTFSAKRVDAKFCSQACVNRFIRHSKDGSCVTVGCIGTACAKGVCSACYKRLARAEGRMRNPGWTESRKAASQRRRAQKRQVPADTFRPAEVFERDGWICGLCEKAVDRSLRYPDPMSSSLDHIVPLAKGGHHVLENVQLAHLRCNLSKGDRVEAVALSR